MELQRIQQLPTLPPRSPDSHKGTYGKVLILAGSRGMAGAAALTGAAALRSGAGLVQVLSPSEVQPTVAGLEPSYMTYPLPHNDLGQIAFEASRPTLERLLADADVLAMGPGLGQSEDTRFLVRWVLTETDLPTVLDADGLNALVGQVDVLETVTRPLILTPHPGELSRLIDRRISEIQRDRIGHAAMLARPVGPLIVVLKGHGTVVTDGERLHVNETGNPGMATGGSGDVLTGVIGALLGQGLSPFEAAVLGVHAHGLAGDIARDQGGEIGMIAGDIVDSLPDAFYHLAQG